MYITVTFGTFCDMFRAHDREHDFSYEAKKALFEYYDELDDHELDVVAISCEWTEYDTEDEVLCAYSNMRLEQIWDNTVVIYLDDGGLILQDF